MEPPEYPLQPVYLHSMKEKVPTILLYNGRKYYLDETAVEVFGKKPDVTKELSKMATTKAPETTKKAPEDKRHRVSSTREGLPELGRVVHHLGRIPIFQNPLTEVAELKKYNRLNSLSIAGVLRKYYPGHSAGSVSTYASSYSRYVKTHDEIPKTVLHREKPTIPKTPLPPPVVISSKEVDKVKEVMKRIGGGSLEDIIKATPLISSDRVKSILDGLVIDHYLVRKDDLYMRNPKEEKD